MLRSAAVAGVVCLGNPVEGQAQFGLPGLGIVFDPTNFARNVLHYQRRIEQMTMQRQQLEAQLLAMQKLQNPNWRSIQGVIGEMEGLLEQSQALAFTLRAIDAEFQNTFPGAQIFRDYPIEQATQAMRTLATIRGALDAAELAARDVPVGLTRLEAIKRQFGTIRGHEEALELNGTVGVYTAEELTLLRHALQAQTNVEAVYFAHQVNADAQAETTVRANLAAMSAPGPRFPGMSLQVTP